MQTHAAMFKLCLVALVAVGSAFQLTGATAVPIVQSVSLSPLQLGIPCSVFNCPGFTQSTHFNLIVGIMNPANAGAINLLTLEFTLEEHDTTSLNDAMGTFSAPIGAPNLLNPGASIVATLSFEVGEDALNSACIGGCDNFAGATGEGFDLEFVGEGKLFWSTIQEPAKVREVGFRVPEPATLWLCLCAFALMYFWRRPISPRCLM